MPQPSNAHLPLAGKRVVLGVTGGIAAYKAIETCRRLVDLGAHVVPVLTNAALKMVGETTFRALASEPPKTSFWNDPVTIPHTHLGQSADAIVVCPATARIISDLRTGRSADLLSATLIATEAPVLVCPAMHTEMWEHPAVAENLEVLAGRGVIIVPPEDGRLAGGDIGRGRLAAPESVAQAVLRAIGPNAHVLKGKKLVVSAGGTREPIDPVRFIGNRSSGKQGHAIAEAALLAGASVTLVTTASLPSSAGIRRIEVETAAQMHHAVMTASHEADAIVMAAAVADFAPRSAADQKMKKHAGVPSVALEPTADILQELGIMKAADRLKSLLVGFAAETQDVAQNALAKLEQKKVDLIVANDVSADQVGFAHSTNAVTIYGNDGFEVALSLRSKEQIADEICKVIADRLKR